MNKVLVTIIGLLIFTSCEFKFSTTSNINEGPRQDPNDTLYNIQRVNTLLVTYPKTYEGSKVTENFYRFRETDTLKDISVFAITYSDKPQKPIIEAVTFCKEELRKLYPEITYTDLEIRSLQSDSLVIFTGRYLKKGNKIGVSFAILKTDEILYILNHHIKNESPDSLVHKSEIFEDLVSRLKID